MSSRFTVTHVGTNTGVRRSATSSPSRAPATGLEVYKCSVKLQQIQQAACAASFDVSIINTNGDMETMAASGTNSPTWVTDVAALKFRLKTTLIEALRFHTQLRAKQQIVGGQGTEEYHAVPRCLTHNPNPSSDPSHIEITPRVTKLLLDDIDTFFSPAPLVAIGGPRLVFQNVKTQFCALALFRPRRTQAAATTANHMIANKTQHRSGGSPLAIRHDHLCGKIRRQVKTSQMDGVEKELETLFK